MMRNYVRFALLLLLIGTLPLAAQEQTGSIEGTVKDATGAVLPGVTVEATSSGSGTVVTTSDSNGQYRFPRLPSGRYQVKASLMGYNAAAAGGIELTLGKVATVNLTLNPAAVTESIVVTAEAPVVDVTQSATSTSIAREQLEYIPKGRDFTSVVAQAAGASNEAFLGGISIDGASGSENRFVIDGVDTTHPQDGLSGQNMITDFIEEIQVKSAGYAAEFGGSLGGVVNAITKTGTNEFDGWVGAYLQDSSWEGAERPTPYEADPSRYRTFEKDDETRLEPGIALGGPILRDRLWFFVGYSPTLISTERTPSGSSRSFEQDDTFNYFTGNIKGNIGSKFLFKAAANLSPREVENILPARDGSTPANANLGVVTESPTESYSAYADFLPSSNFFVSGRVGQYSIDTKTSGVGTEPRIFFRNGTIPVDPSSPLYRPTGFSSVPGASHAEVTADKWERQSGALDANYFLSAFGQHSFKAGVQMENISNEVSRGEPSNLMTFRWGLPDRFGAGVKGTVGSLGVRRFRTEGAAESDNLGIYIQDAWQVRPNFTLNLGVRTESERVPNYGAQTDPTLPEYAIEFDFGEKVAPRLGFAWDVMSNQRVKVYGSYGDYYDITKIEMPRGSFGADKWIEFLFPVNTTDWPSLVAACTGVVNNNPNSNPCPGLGTPAATLDLRHPTDPHDAIDPDLKPMQNREYQLGTDFQLSPLSVVGVRYVNKSLINTIEDIGFLEEVAPGVFEEHYITGNPGKGLVSNDPPGPTPRQPEAVRDYQALEFSYNRLFRGTWSLRAAYTYSELEGNYSGLASSDEFGRTDPNVSRAFDALHNAYDAKGNLVIGPLNSDRPHSFEAQGLYRAPWNTHVGVNFSWMSGTPISEEISYNGVPFFPFGRGNLGRTPNVSRTDLLVTQPFQILNTRLEFSVNVLNLFDQDTATQIASGGNTYSHYRVDLCTVAGCDRANSSDWFFSNVPNLNINQVMSGAAVDPFFMKPVAWQAPRTVRLGVKYNF
ncbi:MAG TPA: TonB-dependent receptor [Thermoanaerobaculia bacterium]|nr:TonB-dependent receptor [Thermoanaerobaculia bacterium]